MPTYTLAADWRDFEDRVLRGCGATQRREMRRAFYAGAHALLCTVQALGNDDVTEAEGASALAALRVEIDAFYRALSAGKA